MDIGLVSSVVELLIRIATCRGPGFDFWSSHIYFYCNYKLIPPFLLHSKHTGVPKTQVNLCSEF